jgi:hypothetical protein
MRTSGRDYLETLGNCPAESFEGRFFRASSRLRLGDLLEWSEMEMLFDAAYRAALCNIAINGLGGCEGRIRPGHEYRRRMLEWEFMDQRSKLFAAPGWHHLEESQRRMITVVFLSVFVTDDNLAV